MQDKKSVVRFGWATNPNFASKQKAYILFFVPNPIPATEIATLERRADQFCVHLPPSTFSLLTYFWIRSFFTHFWIRSFFTHFLIRSFLTHFWIRSFYPEKLFELPCEWNYRVWLCSQVTSQGHKYNRPKEVFLAKLKCLDLLRVWFS